MLLKLYILQLIWSLAWFVLNDYLDGDLKLVFVQV